MRRISLILIGILVLSIPIIAATIHVPSQYPTIQAGIDAAQEGDTVLVADGTYAGNGNKNLDFLGRAITVRSANGAENCIIDCENSGRGFYFHSGEDTNSVLLGFSIINGYTTEIGAGIYCDSSSPTLKNCIISSNYTTWSGGGIALTYGSNALIDNCEIFENSSSGNGGGIHCVESSNPIISYCSIYNNTAPQGAGINVVVSDPTIENCTVVSNNASIRGSGLLVWETDITIINTIISDNNLQGIYFHHIAIPNPDISITYCDFHNNTGGNLVNQIPLGLGIITTTNYNNDSCDVFSNILLDPLFVNPGDEDFHLQADSPSIDAGDPSTPYDPDGTIADIGAYPYYQGSAACGYCFLQGLTTYEDIKVLFQSASPTAVTDSTFTNAQGYYYIQLESGIYNVILSHEGYYEEQIPNVFISGSPVELEDITLEKIGILISGAISGSLLGDTTYIVTDDISVNNGDTLIIEEGTDFLFNGNYEYNINGYLSAVGTEEDSIRFAPIVPDSAWGGISFNSSSDNTSILEYCSIRGTNYCGIKCELSSPTISHCSISNNYSMSNTGGIFLFQSVATIVNCSITDNYSNFGGGGILIMNNSEPHISYSSINENSADSWGGGIYCSNSNPIIEKCVLSGNASNNQGGGIYFDNSDPTIMSCTITGNSAVSDGGGIYCNASDLTVLNTIIEGSIGNGGIYFNNSPLVSLEYNDFFNNSSGNFINPPPYLGEIVAVNLNSDSCDVYRNIFLDPLFNSTIGDSAWYLTIDSPCLDAGDPNSPLDPDGTIIEIGAFNFNQAPPVVEQLTISIDTYDVFLDWEDIPDASIYYIYRSVDPYFDTAVLTPIGNASVSEFHDPWAVLSGAYYYKVTWEQ